MLGIKHIIYSFLNLKDTYNNHYIYQKTLIIVHLTLFLISYTILLHSYNYKKIYVTLFSIQVNIISIWYAFYTFI